MDLELGVGVSQHVSAPQLIQIVQLAEELGYAQLWYANHKLYRDLYVGTTLAAAYARRMQIGTFIAEPYSYHPALIAAAIGSIDEICGGRAILLLGAGAANFGELGLARVKPVRALRECIDICRALLSGERVTYHGEVFTVENSWLHFPTRADLPIYVATRGDKMLEMSGAHADGVMIATYASPRGLQRALDLVDRGCRSVGRTWRDIPIFSRVDACLSDDRQEARNAVKPMVSLLLMGSYPDRSFVHGLGLEVPPDLEAVCRQRNEALSLESWRLVPDELVDAFAWAGTPEEVAQQVARVVDLGIRRITFLPHPLHAPPEHNIRRFAQEVMPRVRALLGASPTH